MKPRGRKLTRCSETKNRVEENRFQSGRNVFDSGQTGEKVREFTEKGNEIYPLSLRRKAKAVQSDNAARASDVMANTAGCVSLRSALMA